MSYIFTFHGRSNVLEADFNPAIDLEERTWSHGSETWKHGGTWVMGLLHFDTFHTVPNVTKENQKMYFKMQSGKITSLTIPEGTYTINHIIDEISMRVAPESHANAFPKHGHLSLWANPNTHTITMHSTEDVDFRPKDSLADLFGFEHKIYPRNQTHIAPNIIRITPINAIRIHCNITVGAFHNGEVSHIIHEFYPMVPPGFKIVEVPKNIIYLPISNIEISNITLKILDENNKPLNLQAEDITVRLHLKRISWE